MTPLFVILLFALDPISATVAALIVRWDHSIRGIFLAGIVAGLAGETLVNMMQGGPWGGMLPFRLVAGLIQAGVAYYIIGMWRRRRGRSAG